MFPFRTEKRMGSKSKKSIHRRRPSVSFIAKNCPVIPNPDYMDWFRRNSGTLGDRMLPEDIAFLRTKGEFYYRDYAELKHNLPRQVFQSAAISYDNPSWKRSGPDNMSEIRWIHRCPLSCALRRLVRRQSAPGTPESSRGKSLCGLPWKRCPS